MIQIGTFKVKEKEGGEGRLQLDGQWKVPMFGGPWKEKKKHPFHLFSLPPPPPPQQILLKPSFYFH
jgi:hypothetical protein